MRKFLLNFFLALVSIVVALAGVEILFHLLAFFHQETWSDKQQKFIDTLTVPFSYGLVRPNASISDLREYFPSGRLQPNSIPIETNRHGMRMRNVQQEKLRDVTRIAALGDSCTFGWMVPEETAYPRVLESLLNAANEKKYEVLNFGVPGYTSYHGLLQYRRTVTSFQPDILILAYGFNDSYEFRFSERDFYEKLKENHLSEGLRGLSLFLYDRSAFGRWSITRLKTSNRRPIESELKERAEKKVWFPRVSRDAYQSNIGDMIEDVKSLGGKTIVLNLDLPNTWVKAPSHETAEKHAADYIDIQDTFFAHSRPDERVASLTHLLRKPRVETVVKDKKYHCTFRVWNPSDNPVADSIYLLINSENHSWPWQLKMHDDGTCGDEIAGDGVWSLEIAIERTELLDYSFMDGPITEGTSLYENSPKALRFYHHIDLSGLPAGSVWSSPVHTLNRIPFEHLMVPGDVIHPNSEGHRSIAEELAPLIMKLCEETSLRQE